MPDPGPPGPSAPSGPPPLDPGFDEWDHGLEPVSAEEKDEEPDEEDCEEPPPPDIPPDPRASGERGAAGIAAKITNGTMSYYHVPRPHFIARCARRTNCSLQLRATRTGNVPAMGRPLGALASYLACAHAFEAEHEHNEHVALVHFSRADRTTERLRFSLILLSVWG